VKAIFWVTWREFLRRKSFFITGIIMVAVGVSLYTSVEFILKAREVAVAAEIDHIGPAFRLIPTGKTAKDLALFDLGSDYFKSERIDKMQKEFSSLIRALDGRLVLRVPVDGMIFPVIGIDPDRAVSPFKALKRLSDNDVVIGKELALKIDKKEGDKVSIKNSNFNVAAILPHTGNADDTAIFLSIKKLQNLFGFPDVVNEIRVFSLPGVKMGTIKDTLSSSYPNISIIGMSRGDVAEHEINLSLSQHRNALYLIMAFVIALCIFIWSYLDSHDRKIEVATVIAVGGTGMTVLGILILKTALVGFIGALIGYDNSGFQLSYQRDLVRETSFYRMFSSCLV
jgi:ABC-type lipoprotein release transport system permease subunit